MDILFFMFLAAGVTAVGLAAIAVWAPRHARIRIIASIGAVLFLPVIYFQFTELLSKPKPVAFEWYERGQGKAEVLSMSLHEGEAIYLWLRLPGSREPRSYVAPWSVKMAEKLEGALEEAVKQDGRVEMKNPFSKRSLQDWGDLSVEIIPPPIPPLKLPKTPPKTVNPRGQKV
jgi:hypothetical protein